MKLWIDDEREAPDKSWTVARTVGEAVRFIARYSPMLISLDGDDGADGFMTVAYFIGEKYRVNELQFLGKELPTVIIHSANPIVAGEMHNLLIDYGIPSELKPNGKLK